MANGLAGKVVLIFGASRGIGAASAVAFAREGARLVLGSRDVPAMEALAASLPASAETRVIRADMTAPADLERAVSHAVEQFGRLDIAFNNAGVSHKRVPFAELGEDVFDVTMDTNVRGTFLAMKHEIAAMLKSGGGSIVNTGSISGLVALPGFAAYCASKCALIGLTKCAALDYAAQNIRVNLIAPGPVDTLTTRQNTLATPEGRQRIIALTPMGRISEPEEIAAAVVWLASPAASFITGAVVPADGGYTLP
jgi:A-factor type gamma-butyrolactone 1'-reductase (1S-forming)